MLEKLAGGWDVEMVLEGRVMARSRTVAEFIEDGNFLVIRAETTVDPDAPQVWHDNAPRQSWVVVGSDDYSGRYSYVYADSRDVHRLHDMEFDGTTWAVSGRSGEEFFQRFVGRMSEDGSRIDCCWERSTDDENWELDFEGSYTRAD